jgi:WD40 repeat protein
MVDLDKPIVTWNVYGPQFDLVDLPVNWTCWNPITKQMAVVSGPKNPSMPPPPPTDLISPVLPRDCRITIYDLGGLVISKLRQLDQEASIESNRDEISTPPILKHGEFFPNGEVLLSFCRPHNVAFGMLSALIVDAKRSHRVVLFHKESLDIDKAAVYECSGGSVSYFSATPSGDALVVLKSTTLHVFKPIWDELTSAPVLEMTLSIKISDSECSPFHWLDGNDGKKEFLTFNSRGLLLHYRISADLSVAELVRSVQTDTSGNLYHLIWEHGDENYGLLIRVGMVGLETLRMPSCISRAPAGQPVHSTNNLLHNLTCCGLGFDNTGRFLAIGDWSGLVSVWRVAPPTPSEDYKLDSENSMRNQFSPTHNPEATIPLRRSMVRSLTWNRHPYNDGRLTIMVGDLSGRLLECGLRLDKGRLTISAPIKIDRTYRSILCMQWSPESCSYLTNGPWKCFLATGDSNGILRVYGRSKTDDSLALLVSFQAHIQMPHVTSHDIWTLSFSPCGRFIATGCEDYTVHVYKFAISNNAGLEQIATLEGPDAAVTCIDWQVTPLGTMLIVASDDRTIHCWRQTQEDTGSLELFRVIRTNWEHLMITYACLESNGTHLACTTMSGYIYVFDLAKDGARTKCKAHLGSIEGLAWNRANDATTQLAICSSDCTSTLFQLKRV